MNCLDCGKELKWYTAKRCKSCANREIASRKLGSHLSSVTKRKISNSVTLFFRENPTVIGFKKGHKLNVGRRYSPERNAKVSGENHWNWKGGIYPEMERIRKSQQYKLWRKAVFERDNYACVLCGKRGVELHADHIKQFSLYPDLRFEVSNGRTLCVPCHETTPSYKKQLYEERA